MVSTINQHEGTAWGTPIAFVVIGLWIVTFIGFLAFDVQSASPIWSILAFLVRVFLSTGLFITAHDAMHGSVSPDNLKLNHQIGAIALRLYALFPYQELLRKHHLHHRFPTGDHDPDFCENQSFVAWYFHFMRDYWSWKQFFGMQAIQLFIEFALHVSFVNLLLFWLIPLVFSSLQLFCFGTYLPHRRSPESIASPYHSKSYPLPMLLSFLTCYHFGYHEEHHQYPQVPWWELPGMHRQSNAG
jgi:beta-carotene/zeaxanthin 4-ketolase